MWPRCSSVRVRPSTAAPTAQASRPMTTASRRWVSADPNGPMVERLARPACSHRATTRRKARPWLCDCMSTPPLGIGYAALAARLGAVYAGPVLQPISCKFHASSPEGGQHGGADDNGNVGREIARHGGRASGIASRETRRGGFLEQPREAHAGGPFGRQPFDAPRPPSPGSGRVRPRSAGHVARHCWRRSIRSSSSRIWPFRSKIRLITTPSASGSAMTGLGGLSVGGLMPAVRACHSNRLRSSFAEDVGAKLITGDLPATLFVQSASESSIKALPLTKRLSQIADGRPGPLGVLSLVVRTDGCEVVAESVHTGKLPYGKDMSIPFGKLPASNRDWRDE
ncbi:hypothetical protein NB688_000566 [Xanthomonas sacchari]|uniref:Uncharacterized protein n=1 Tax=Xanthomonas sacchari TaxID=56458 RepID=A0ABT3DTL7_9XANT|nr:hypothetical protein [Xanthomonas sacchari]MCW0418400.1 hypothetical protein [Xanthomonas sacchari]